MGLWRHLLHRQQLPGKINHLGGTYNGAFDGIASQAIVTVSASVLNLTAMSIDRYKAIVWPLRARNSARCVGLSVAFIWAASCAFAAPTLAFSTA